ncbi:preprotein translocase subunit SecE [Actinophytocola oryzae]|uniref:Protein translocase subunit SecE n=1 Tax=Actinophytocola oryzae TaxID=502181 RepID=A0A4R7V9E5_9PSEU|nr:preprotein translocase subunit SecE [Actinophytocola oryzae]TDV45548.1 preprotein translocase subunit SecE [Actinophytocola oryzae]
MVDDRDKEESKGQERPSRPVTAAARRERRASARPAARKEASTDEAAKPARTGAKSTADEKVKPKAKAKVDAKSDAKTAATKGEHKKGRPTPTRDRKESGPGFFARIFRFLKEVVAELRKVIWPTRKQMITYTAVVLVFVAFMVALIAGIDFGLAKGVLALFG